MCIRDRPKTNEKDAYFFSHDCNARNDPKILALRSVYGAEGYGVLSLIHISHAGTHRAGV